MKICEELTIEQRDNGTVLLKTNKGLTYTSVFVILTKDEASLLVRSIESYLQDIYVADMKTMMEERYNRIPASQPNSPTRREIKEITCLNSDVITVKDQSKL